MSVPLLQSQALEELDVAGNPLGALPDSLGSLGSLKYLNAMNCQVGLLWHAVVRKGVFFPAEALLVIAWAAALRLQGCIEAMRWLQLALCCCHSLSTTPTHRLLQLTALPDSIGGCTALLRLGLKGNRLVSLPASIGQLASLVELYLTGGSC